MSSDKILLRVEERTDFLGTYVAYVYGDGRVETDPPDRPVSKEDYQRRRALELSQRDTAAAIAAVRLSKSTGRANLNRDQAGSSATASALDEMRRSLQIAGMLVEASTMPETLKDQLLVQVDLGGRVIGPNAGIEFGVSSEQLDGSFEDARELR